MYQVQHNLSNWTGEEYTVLVIDGEFEMYGYHWKIEEVARFEEGCAFTLACDEWGEGVRLINLDTSDEPALVRQAMVWIGNCV